MKTTAFALFIAVPLSVSLAADDLHMRTVPFEAAPVALQLVQYGALGKSEAWPQGNVALETLAVDVHGKTIDELLERNFVFPDVEAYALVYALNPSLARLDDLREFPKVRLPRVKADAELTSRLRDKHVILLTVDPAAKRQYLQVVDNLRLAVVRLRENPASAFESKEVPGALLESVVETAGQMDRIATRIKERTGRPIPVEVMEHLLGDAKAMSTVLGDATSGKKKIGNAETELLEGVVTDTSLKASRFGEEAAATPPGRWPKVDVTVKTLRDQQKVDGLRVFYVNQALQNDPAAYEFFRELSSPTSGPLYEAKYCFWAVRENARGTRVTDTRCFPISAGDTRPIELTVR